MKDISKLTEKTQEIKSSDGKQVGIVEETFKNDIAMKSYVGKGGTFILPRDMIDKIRRKTIYLNLTKDEFESWWKKEGSQRIAEYPARIEVAIGRKLIGEDLERLREDVRSAFDNYFGQNIIMLFLESGRCPHCGSSIKFRKRSTCSSCGLSFAENNMGKLEMSPKHRDSLLDEQEGLRQTFSSSIRELLHFDEWVCHSVNFYERRPHYLSVAEDVFVVTSKRIVRFKSDGTSRHNWEIPMDKMIDVSSFVEVRLETGEPIDWVQEHWRTSVLRTPPHRRVPSRTHHFRIFRFDYTSGKGIRSKEVVLLKEYDQYADPRKAESIDKYVKKAIEVMKLRKSMGIK